MRAALALALALAAAPSCASEPSRAEPALCPGGVAAEWPPAPHALAPRAVLPPGLVFGDVRLDAYFEPCAARSRILVVRTTAAWCGTCRWHATHARGPAFERAIVVDLLVGDEDNAAPEGPAIERWRALAGTATGPDPAFTFGPVLPVVEPLPQYVLVDTRTMRILAALADPDGETLASRIAIELAALDGAPPPPLVSPTLHDGLLTTERWDLVREMALVAEPPPDPTNAFADAAAAAALGRALFFDAGLSPSGAVACATCHDPARGFADGRPQAVGVARVDRNTPSIALAAHARWQNWDGRADSLWAQALLPLEDAREMASSRAFVAHRIASRWSAEYAAAFPGRALGSLAGVPPAGKPGDAAYDALDAETKDRVTGVFVDAGKAIAAYERSLRVKPSAFDRYAAGDAAALTEHQRHALVLFFANGCAQCHWGPRLTNDAFHALRFPTGRVDGAADPGRAPGRFVSDFDARSRWSDAPASRGEPGAQARAGAFKTPGLRGLGATAPYGHGGTFATLEEVMLHYGERGLAAGDPRAVGETEPWVPSFDTAAARELVPLFEALGADVETF